MYNLLNIAFSLQISILQWTTVGCWSLFNSRKRTKPSRWCIAKPQLRTSSRCSNTINKPSGQRFFKWPIRSFLTCSSVAHYPIRWSLTMTYTRKWTPLLIGWEGSIDWLWYKHAFSTETADMFLWLLLINQNLNEKCKGHKHKFKCNKSTSNCGSSNHGPLVCVSKCYTSWTNRKSVTMDTNDWISTKIASKFYSGTVYQKRQRDDKSKRIMSFNFINQHLLYMGYQTEFLIMWFKMSMSGVTTMDFQYGCTAKSHGADDPPDEGLGDMMLHVNQIFHTWTKFAFNCWRAGACSRTNRPVSAQTCCVAAKSGDRDSHGRHWCQKTPTLSQTNECCIFYGC